MLKLDAKRASLAKWDNKWKRNPQNDTVGLVDSVMASQKSWV